MRYMAENFNIEVKTTDGYIPWSDTTLNLTLTISEITMKVKTSNHCDWSIATVSSENETNCDI